ncbi:general secretion pathway protein GspB [Thalassolituus sp.]|uniref:general secretion pathway protein GspB n=1 Tax=Thalassolituus sp. TaxID=2030822 RepID=UPI003515B9EA
MNKILTGLVAAVLFLPAIVFAVGDPTRPPQFAPVEVKPRAAVKRSLELQQILVAGEKRSAVINGTLVREGDTVSGARVVRITPDQVVVKIRKKHQTLSLIKRTKHSEKK